MMVFANYFYVENYYQIPQSWIDNLRDVCAATPRKTAYFHKQNMTQAGYYVYLPGVYFWKALQHSSFGKVLFPDVWHLNAPGIEVSKFGTLFRLLLIIIAEYFVKNTVVLTFYDTKDLEVVPDFILKRVVFSLTLSLFSGSPCDNYIWLLFRKPLEEDADKQLKKKE